MIVISVCIGSACHVKGAHEVIKGLERLIEEKKMKDIIELRGAFCIGKCTKAVSVRVNNEEEVFSVNLSNLERFFYDQVISRFD